MRVMISLKDEVSPNIEIPGFKRAGRIKLGNIVYGELDINKLDEVRSMNEVESVEPNGRKSF